MPAARQQCSRNAPAQSPHSDRMSFIQWHPLVVGLLQPTKLADHGAHAARCACPRPFRRSLAARETRATA
eukprot:2026265-Alexandrium_andersonii.AAC.1